MSTSSQSASLVVCIGNELIADDAAGYEVWRRLQEMQLPEETRIEFASVGGIALLDLLTGNEGLLIVVDAVQLGAPPGTIHHIMWNEIPFKGNSAISAHGIGLREAMEVGKLLFPEKLPQNIILIGIEGRCFNRTRDAMTREIEDAIEPAAIKVNEEINKFHRGTYHAQER
jgi:hydrogenase maturation protease